MRKTVFSLALVVALLLSSAGGRAGSVQAGIDIWTQTSQGMWGGSISALAISPDYATDNTVFAGTYNGGLFKSTDGGDSWDNTGLDYISGMGALAISPNYASDNTIFAGVYDAGVFKSTDGGSSWTEVNTGLTKLRVAALVISPHYATDNTIFVGIWIGMRDYGHPVFKSIDGGDSWTEVSTGLPYFSLQALAISPDYATDNTIFAGTWAGGVFKSTNGGDSWAEVNTGLTNLLVHALAISPNYATDSTVFATTRARVFKSTNGGDSWTEVPNLRASTLAISPNYASDNTIFAGTGTGVFKSTNGGDSWIQVSTWAANELAISPNYATDSTIFAGIVYDGVFKSTDSGDSWTEVNTGLTNLHVETLAISPNYATDSTIFAGTWGGGVFKSTNGGDSWTEVNTGLTNLRVRALAISPDYATDNTIFAGTSRGVFKSTDGGDSWTNSGLTNLSVQALAISPNYASDNTIFAATRYGGGYWGLLKSSDGGNSWDNTGLGKRAGIHSLAISPNYASDNTIFAGGYTGVLKSTDGGDSWTNTLTNGSFEQGPRIPVPWKGKNLTAKDRRVCWVRHSGRCSFRMVGTKARKSLRQVVRGSGNAGDRFTLTARSKAENPLRRGGAYCLVAKVFHTDGTKKNYRICFAKRTHGWQRRIKTFNTVKDYNKIVVSLHYNRQGGRAWFDDVRLVVERVRLNAHALAISPNHASDNTIFAGTWAGGVFKSINGGSSWSEVNTGLTNLSVGVLAISPNYATDNTIFAGTYDGGVFKSTDGGSSWSAMNAGLGSLRILALARHPNGSADHIRRHRRQKRLAIHYVGERRSMIPEPISLLAVGRKKMSPSRVSIEGAFFSPHSRIFTP